MKPDQPAPPIAFLIARRQPSMASYMPQHVFNMCAVTAVQYNSSEGRTIEEFAKCISDKYRRHYIDDGYEEDIVLAARNVTKFIESSFPGTKAATSVRQLQYCIKKFHPTEKNDSFCKEQSSPSKRPLCPAEQNNALPMWLFFIWGPYPESFH